MKTVEECRKIIDGKGGILVIIEIPPRWFQVTIYFPQATILIYDDCGSRCFVDEQAAANAAVDFLKGVK